VSVTKTRRLEIQRQSRLRHGARWNATTRLKRQLNHAEALEKEAAKRQRDHAQILQTKKRFYQQHRAQVLAECQLRDSTYRERRNERERQRRTRKRQGLVDLTPMQWEFILERFHGGCAYCDRHDVPLTQDHVTPIARGGAHTASNVVPACASCNQQKGLNGPLRPVQPMLEGLFI
jgi:5-methylcytosine-specific restriction endonuclease McrA